MIHDSIAFDAPMLVRIVGTATLTMVVSSSAMNAPDSNTASDNHPLRSAARDFVASAVISVAVTLSPPRPFIGDDFFDLCGKVLVPSDFGAQSLRVVGQHELFGGGQVALDRLGVRLPFGEHRRQRRYARIDRGGHAVEMV